MLALFLLMFYIMGIFIHPYIAFLVFVVLCGLWEDARKSFEEDEENYKKFREAGHSKFQAYLMSRGVDYQKVIDFIKSVSFLNIIRNVILFFLLLLTGPFALLMFIYWDKLYKPIIKNN